MLAHLKRSTPYETFQMEERKKSFSEKSAPLLNNLTQRGPLLKFVPEGLFVGGGLYRDKGDGYWLCRYWASTPPIGPFNTAQNNLEFEVSNGSMMFRQRTYQTLSIISN